MSKLQENRIAKILDSSNTFVNKENLEKYRKYLIEKLKGQVILSGIEDFPWEEKYVFGFGSEEEYKALKKKNPSYTDKYKLLKIEPLNTDFPDLLARLSRRSDLRKFTIPLSTLKSIDPESENYQLLNDFSVWIVNY